MRIKLNGIQRIGIVVSAIAFVGFAVAAWIFDVREKNDFYGYQLGMCYRILNLDNDAMQYIEKQDQREKQRSTNTDRYEQCKVVASNFHTAQFNASKSGIPILLAIEFFVILLGWLRGA